jgi:hypothetical protein
VGQHRPRPGGRRHDGLALAAAGRQRRVPRRGELVDKAKKVAAKLLEADEADVVLDKDAGAFHVSGTPPISKSWADLAVAAKGDPDLPEGLMPTRPSTA